MRTFMCLVVACLACGCGGTKVPVIEPVVKSEVVKSEPVQTTPNTFREQLGREKELRKVVEKWLDGVKNGRGNQDGMFSPDVEMPTIRNLKSYDLKSFTIEGDTARVVSHVAFDNLGPNSSITVFLDKHENEWRITQVTGLE